MSSEAEDPAIARWRFARLLKTLEESRGTATSMITLILRSGCAVSDTVKMLTNEYGAAENIKSRVNRQSVQSAIVSAQQRLKLYHRVPPNGLVLFVGTLDNDKKVTMDIEPPKPVNTSYYRCDNQFHTESLRSMLDDNDKYGFIVIDGNSTLFATLCGTSKQILMEFEADLPKKHNKGGQSSVRFARLRIEKRHNYLRKMTELATQCFITDNMPNVKGIILAGSADFKLELSKSDMFDPRLKKVVLKLVDTSYGSENGLNQAIELSADCLAGVRFLEEKKIIGGFFEEIARDTNKYCYGLRDTLTALESGAVNQLLVWEDLTIERLVVSNGEGEKVVYNSNDVKDGYTVKEREPYVEWLARNYKKYGTTLVLVTDRSPEGSQFCRGFSGIGGLLRYPMNFDLVETIEDTGDSPITRAEELDLGL